MPQAIELEAAYRLPASIILEAAAFGSVHEISLAGMDGVLLLPAVDWRDERPWVVAPRIHGLNAEQRVRYLEDGWRAWGQISEWNRGGSFEAGAVEMVVFRFGDTPASDVQYSEYLYGKGHPTGQLVESLFRAVDAWFSRLAAWVSAVTDQDTDAEMPLVTVRALADGLQVWSIEEGVTSLPASAHSLTVVRQRYQPLKLAQLSTVLDLVARELEVPAEHALLAQARWALRRRQYRRAVLEAATACELALNRMLEARLSALPGDVRAALLADQRTLGPLAQLVRRFRVLPEDLTEGIVRPRNSAMHRGEEPDRPTASRAIALAESLVALVEPLPA